MGRSHKERRIGLICSQCDPDGIERRQAAWEADTIYLRTSSTVLSNGLNRESSYSSSTDFCLIFFLVSRSLGAWSPVSVLYYQEGGLPTLVNRTPINIKELIASCSGNDSRACWYSLRRSSSGTPSRYWMYKATMRTLFAFLKRGRGRLWIFWIFHLHDIPAIEKWHHFLHQSLRRLPLSIQAGGTTLRSKGLDSMLRYRVSRYTCSTLATSGNLSRSKIPIHSSAILRCKEN